VSAGVKSGHRPISSFDCCLSKVTRLGVQRNGRDQRHLRGPMVIIDAPYLNNVIASSASTPPVMEIEANGALAATSALDSMI
jgi:hypothetical protein